MNKEFLHMQKLAGLITESEYKQKIKENKIGNIDLDLIKKLQNSPEIKKIAQKLKSDKNLLNKAIKFAADTSSNKLNEDEEIDNLLLQQQALNILPNSPEYISFKSGETYLAGKKLDSYSSDELKQLIDTYQNKFKNSNEPPSKLKQILTSAGLGALTGLLQGTFIVGPNDSPLVYISSAIVGALMGIGVGAAATDGFNKKLEENDESNIEKQILKIIDLGKKL